MKLTARDRSGDAHAGVRAALIDHLFGTTGTGRFTDAGVEVLSGRRLRKMLESPRLRGVVEEILPADDRRRLDRLTRAMMRAETTDVPTIQALDPSQVPLLETIVRIAGARIGGALAAETQGGSIQTANIMAQRFRDWTSGLMQRFGVSNSRKILADAIQDQELFEQLLRHGKGHRFDADPRVKRLNAWLLAEGYETAVGEGVAVAAGPGAMMPIEEQRPAVQPGPRTLEAAPPAAQPQGSPEAPVELRSRAEYDALPSGSVYRHPNGQVYRKP